MAAIARFDCYTCRMFRSLLRPLGFVLLAVLATAPAARALCVWECAPAARETAIPATERAGHCAQPAGDDVETAALVSLDACDSCDRVGETPRATARPDSTTIVTLAPSPTSTTPARDPLAAQLVSASAHATSPPLCSPYPLRI
jgi:hypothetical protein